MSVQLSLDETYADVAPVRTDASGAQHLLVTLLLAPCCGCYDNDAGGDDDCDCSSNEATPPAFTHTSIHHPHITSGVSAFVSVMRGCNNMCSYVCP